MKTKISSRKMPLVALLLGCLGNEAAVASSVSYLSVDLADTTSDQDLWQYRYWVEDFPPFELHGFTVFFDAATYSGLNPVSAPSDWDVLVFQPDSGLPSSGAYDALALIDNPSVAAPFVVNFVWGGGPGTKPGSQPFEINQFDVSLNLITTVQSGDTTPVPIPPSIVLMGSLIGFNAVRLLSKKVLTKTRRASENFEKLALRREK